MFNLISRTVDYPLHSLLGFNIHKISLETFAHLDPSLTLVSELYTTGEPVLALTTRKHQNDNEEERGQSIEDIAHEIENLLHSSNYDVQINPLKVHSIDEDLNDSISNDKLSVLSKHVFLENAISTVPVDLYDFVFAIQSKNLVPVLNFPEMDPHFTSKNQRLLRLEDRGCVFHIDLLSLTGYNGQEAKRVASSLLQNNQVHFVSLQIQQLEQIKKNNGIRISRKIAGLLAEQLFHDSLQI